MIIFFAVCTVLSLLLLEIVTKRSVDNMAMLAEEQEMYGDKSRFGESGRMNRRIRSGVHHIKDAFVKGTDVMFPDIKIN